MRDRTRCGRRIPFRVYLTLATAGLIFLTSAIILLDVSHQSQTAAKADAEEAYTQVADGVGRQFDSLLRDNSGRRWILTSSATPDVFKECLGGSFVSEAFSGR